jgi:ketosteroid isomerase-like protein
MENHHEPGDLVADYVSAFNARSASVVDELYEPGSLLVPSPGHAVTGAERGAAVRHLMGLGAPMTARTRQVFVTGEIALLVVDWSIDGSEIHLSGAAADVARCGADGRWRYVIDNPFGTG